MTESHYAEFTPYNYEAGSFIGHYNSAEPRPGKTAAVTVGDNTVNKHNSSHRMNHDTSSRRDNYQVAEL